MKNFRNIFLLLLAGLIVVQGCSSVKRGNKYYSNYDYPNAIKHFEKVNYERHPSALEKLAHCYRLVKNYQDAELAYAKAAALEKKDPMVHFYYGEVLRNNGKFQEAQEQYKIYLNRNPNDAVAKGRVKAIDEVKILLNQVPQYDLVSLQGVNTSAAEFSPMYFKEGLVFVAERTRDLINFNKYEWNSQPFLDIYYTESKGHNSFSRSKEFSGRINSAYHDGPISFNEDQTMAFFTRVDVTTKKDTSFVNRPRIYMSTYEKGIWKKPQPFFLNSDIYSVAHPAVSPDGKLLFFVSDMPGGRGGKDIYVCKFEGDKWGNALNLGPEVNTPGDELFPYFRKDGTLFFSSDGHTGLGGLDIYSANLEGLKWTNVSNAGQPINSTTDDFGIVFEDGGYGKGYFSSNRAGGKGSDDIYGFVTNGKFLTLSGKILLSQDIGDPAKNAKVMLLREDGTVVKVTSTNESGFFKFDQLPADQKYLVKLDENDPSLVDKSRYYMTDEKDKIVRVTVLNEKGGKFVFQNLPADPNSLPQLDVNDVSIAGNLLVGSNPAKPLANAKVNLVDEKGEIIGTTTTNAFGAFVFTNLPPDRNFLVKIDESDSSLPPNSKVTLTNKSGKELQSTTTGSKGEFRFKVLAADKATMDVISVEDAELRFDMSGQMLSPDKKPLANQKVNLVNEKGEVVQTVTTDAQGKFNFNSLPADRSYLVMMDENDSGLTGMDKIYVADTKGNVVRELTVKSGKFQFRVLAADEQSLASIYVDDPWLKVLQLKSQNQEVKKDSLTIIENIYYEYGKWELMGGALQTLDKVIQVMKSDADISIEISSHTDSRSSAEFNLTLSQKRAKAAVDYMVHAGIPAKRITGIGYGEAKVINRCREGVECSEEEHASNRRTEFRIVRKQSATSNTTGRK